MDIFQAIRDLLGGGQPQRQAPQQQKTPLVGGYRPEPAYVDAAMRYDKNPFSREFVGQNAIDPKHFGYPPDGGYPLPPTYQSPINGATNPTPWIQRGGTPASIPSSWEQRSRFN